MVVKRCFQKNPYRFSSWFRIDSSLLRLRNFINKRGCSFNLYAPFLYGGYNFLGVNPDYLLLLKPSAWFLRYSDTSQLYCAVLASSCNQDIRCTWPADKLSGQLVTIDRWTTGIRAKLPSSHSYVVIRWWNSAIPLIAFFMTRLSCPGPVRENSTRIHPTASRRSELFRDPLWWRMTHAAGLHASGTSTSRYLWQLTFCSKLHRHSPVNSAGVTSTGLFTNIHDHRLEMDRVGTSMKG